MALVDYASSSSSEDVGEGPSEVRASTQKRKRNDDLSDLPPLPSKFHDLYASTTRLSSRDDPSLHGGRKRVTPHIEGNWPTHLYIEWYPSTVEHGSLAALISELQAKISSDDGVQSFLTSDLGAPLPLHVSLSRPIGLATEQKDSFITSLEQGVKSSGVRPFALKVSTFDWVPNFEKTRWFLVLRLQRPDADGLNRLLTISNTTVQRYGQPPLYVQSAAVMNDKSKSTPRLGKDGTKAGKTNTRSSRKVDRDFKDVSDSFHISVAWTLQAPNQNMLEVTKSLTKDNQHFEKVKQIRIKVEEIKAKLGNIVTNMQLPSKVMEGKSLFGF